MRTANTIAELAVALPSSIPVLERLGIDYCCRGAQSIQQASRNAGVTPEELLTMVESEPVAAPARSWESESPQELMRFIVDSHHAYTHTSLQTLQTLAVKVNDVHGANHEELVIVQKLASELMTELIPHMLKEEQVLFPYVGSLAAAAEAGTEAPMPFFGTVRNPIEMMILEHEAAGEKMAELRGVTMDYALPEDACTSYRALYSLLQELERDLHRHIHLENNILFPRALDLESKTRDATFAGTFGDHSCGR